jgi:2,3-bisphosphoglycerate-dependent phosphoglycerate mutase
MIMSNLFLARHGESSYNRDNLFTGWIDAPLTDKGRSEANAIASKLECNSFDKAYTSKLIRAHDSLNIVLNAINRIDIPIIESEALNERHYGDLQGLNKAETAQRFGEERVRLWRRSYSVAPPNGESLKDTAMRVLPFFHTCIMNDVAHGQNVLVLAHGNSLRAIVMDIDHLSEEEILTVVISTGEVIRYAFDPNMNVIFKEVL